MLYDPHEQAVSQMALAKVAEYYPKAL